jgi:hypothetical protein
MKSSALSRRGTARAVTLGAMVVLCLAALLILSRRAPENSEADPMSLGASGPVAAEPEGELSELEEPPLLQQREERPLAEASGAPEAAPVQPSTSEADSKGPPAGCIELIVSGGEASAPANSAYAVRVELKRKGRPPFDPDQAAATAALGADLKATLCDLKLGYYMTWLHVRDTASYGTVASVSSTTGCRVSIRLGDASMQGRVLDADQRPSAGACVRARTTSGGNQVVEARTDERGMYLLPRLVPGTHNVEVYLPGTADHKPSYTRVVELTAESKAIENFEPEAGSATVSGVIRGPSGDAVLGTETQGAKVDFVQRKTKDGFPATVTKSGEYRVIVDAGEYDVWVTPPGFKSPQLAAQALRVDAVGLESDLTITGSVLVGIAYESDRVTPRPSDDKGRGSSVRFYRKDRSWEMMFVPVTESGRYQIHGLSAGTWMVAIGQDSLDSDVEVEISEGGIRHELDLFAAP